MARIFMVIAALAGAVAVGFGAFGAHYVRDTLSPSRFDVYLTGIRYLFVHAVILFTTAKMLKEKSSRLLKAACVSFLVGMIAFSGSLVLLGISGMRILGVIAPIGGTGYILGWLFLASAAWRQDD